MVGVVASIQEVRRPPTAYYKNMSMKQTEHENSRIEICRNCQGVGSEPLKDYQLPTAIRGVCPICGGSGKVNKHTRVIITITPAP